MEKNILIVQIGEGCSVTNTALTAILDAARDNKGFGKVYASIGGLIGLLNEELADLTELSCSDKDSFAQRPYSVIGTSAGNLNYDFGDYEFSRMIEVFEAHGITELITLSDRIGLSLTRKIISAADKAGYKLNVAAVPLSAYNDIPTDSFSTGYITAASLFSSMLSPSYAEMASYRNDRSLILVETPEKYSGWLSMSSVLSEYNGRKIADLTFIPEFPFDRSDFVLMTVDILRKQSMVSMSVFSKGLTNKDGSVFFPCYELSHDKYGELYMHELCSYLAYTARVNILENIRVIKPDQLLRGAVSSIALYDINRAKALGSYAVKSLSEGGTDFAADIRAGVAVSVALSEIEGRKNSVTDDIYDPVNYKVIGDFSDKLSACIREGSVSIPTCPVITVPEFPAVEKLLAKFKIKFG